MNYKRGLECLIRYTNTEKWVQKTTRSELRRVWISSETLFLVFDIALYNTASYSRILIGSRF